MMSRGKNVVGPAALLLAVTLTFTFVAGSTSFSKDRIDHQGPPRQCAGYSTNNPAYEWCLEDAKRKQIIRGGY